MKQNFNRQHRALLYASCSQSVVPGASALVLPENSLEFKILDHTPD